MVGQTPLNQENQKWHYPQKFYRALPPQCGCKQAHPHSLLLTWLFGQRKLLRWSAQPLAAQAHRILRLVDGVLVAG
jgi:hypothetical protein